MTRSTALTEKRGDEIRRNDQQVEYFNKRRLSSEVVIGKPENVNP